MTTIKHKNFSKDKLYNANPKRGDKFISCNFSQELAHTKIFPTIKDLVFEDCNLFNCDLAATHTRVGGLHIHKDCCVHLHPTWTNLPPEAENCRHVVDTDEVTIDTVPVAKIYHYEDTIE